MLLSRALLLFFAAFSLPAAAADIRPVFKLDGEFGFCLADLPYQDGRRLSVAFSPKDEINVGLMIPGGGFTLRGQYDLAITLTKTKARGADPLYDRNVRAIGMDERSILLQMGSNAAFIKALTDSDLFIVKSGSGTMEFALPAMKSLLDSLKACNKKNRGGKTQAQQAPQTKDEAMPEAVRALLIEAGFQSFSPLRMDDVPQEQRPADILWKTGNLIGGLREQIVPKEKDLSALIGLHLEGLKKNCSGAFKTQLGKEVKTSGLVLRTAEVECLMKDSKSGKDIAVFSAILFYLTTAHRFTFFTHEGVLADKDAAMAARDALMDVIVRLAGG